MKIVGKFLQELRNIAYELVVRASVTKPVQLLNVPFVSQYARQEHAEAYANGELRKIDDPYWRDSGATSPEHYTAWASVVCGMACTAMCIKFFLDEDVSPITLAEDALLYGVYKKSTESISAMHYREYAAWVHRYSLLAKVYTRLSLHGICFAISNGNLVMVSVSPRIRESRYEAGERGGHIVLVIGYDRARKTLTIHNPSGFVSNSTHKSHTLSFNEFEQYYAGRGIIISAQQ